MPVGNIEAYDEETKALIRKIVELTGLSEDEAIMQMQQARQTALFDQPSAQGKMVGDRYVPASIGQHAARGLQRHKAGKRLGELEQEREDTRGPRATLREQILQGNMPGQGVQRINNATQGDISTPTAMPPSPRPEAAPRMLGPTGGTAAVAAQPAGQPGMFDPTGGQAQKKQQLLAQLLRGSGGGRY